MWPAVIVKLRSQDEVDCLLRALSDGGHRAAAREGFQVEVGGASPAIILGAIQGCLTEEGLEPVSIVVTPRDDAVSSRLHLA